MKFKKIKISALLMATLCFAACSDKFIQNDVPQPDADETSVLEVEFTKADLISKLQTADELLNQNQHYDEVKGPMKMVENNVINSEREVFSSTQVAELISNSFKEYEETLENSAKIASSYSWAYGMYCQAYTGKTTYRKYHQTMYGTQLAVAYFWLEVNDSGKDYLELLDFGKYYNYILKAKIFACTDQVSIKFLDMWGKTMKKGNFTLEAFVSIARNTSTWYFKKDLQCKVGKGGKWTTYSGLVRSQKSSSSRAIKANGTLVEDISLLFYIGPHI